MRPEDLSRTQWVIVGLLLGLLLSYIRLQIGQPDPSQTHTLANLEVALLKPPTRGSDGRDYPWVTDLRVYPPEPIVKNGAASTVPENLVLLTFNVRTPAAKQGQLIPAAIHLREPVNPSSRRVEGSDFTVRAYLDAVGAVTGSGKVYRYVWWAEPKWVYITWTAMTMLMVGGVWPLALSVLIGAGFGRRSEEGRLSLWQQWKAYRQEAGRRAKASSSDSSQQKKTHSDAAGLTPQEMSRLNAMEAGLHDFLITGSGDAQNDTDAAPAAPAIRVLTAGPVDAPHLDQKPDDRSYGGTFYPTVAHGKSKRPEDNTGAARGE